MSHLINIAVEADQILNEELGKKKIKAETAEIRIYDVRTVGVQGDKRTYSYPAEINLRELKYHNGKLVREQAFSTLLSKISTRLTNEVSGIGRVVYVVRGGKDN